MKQAHYLRLGLGTCAHLLAHMVLVKVGARPGSAIKEIW